uniref:J domain-containing protein n=1 Tax=Chromera velia CCMP2878 TaxID=1169474 RepID=A0A0G4G0H1_9ALVE|eukprot:Cvel_514.t1-p1 / transcript=Cvel_514.t1 / gene=Cvel_514 / organism=Chromera_velia_CCMP2878 / gene_product=DnaJ homolog subfamily C member 7 homolog, putative / transcript_product=DnaJ homolog subfamily C member 7 homolog, putative / location=Cvel_scaffold16:44287-53409(+) / protein_length=1793 / sequence_SO=supercontig / SO=protein_coding / is_pseudo=false
MASFEEQLRKFGSDLDRQYFLQRQRCEQEYEFFRSQKDEEVSQLRIQLEDELNKRSTVSQKLEDVSAELEECLRHRSNLQNICTAQAQSIAELRKSLSLLQSQAQRGEKKLSNEGDGIGPASGVKKEGEEDGMEVEEEKEKERDAEISQNPELVATCVEQIRRGHLRGVTSLLEANPSLAKEETILEAARSFDELMQHSSVAQGTDPDEDEATAAVLAYASEKQLKNLLCRAAREGASYFIEGILRAVARRFVVSTSDETGNSPLVLACGTGDLRSAEVLLRTAPSCCKVPSGDSLLTPLHVACERGDQRLVETLFARGADPTDGSRDAEGRTVREAALSGGFPSVVEQVDNQAVIVMSVKGNESYKAGDYEGAKSAYHDAISLCKDLHNRSVSDVHADNLTKLHYNKARALYRLCEWTDAISECDECLRLDPEYVNAISQRAQCHCSLFQWEAAAGDYKTLMTLMPSDPEWASRWEESNRQANMDLYSVLDVPRHAPADLIKKAYRKLVLKWHPDKHNGKSADQQKRANALFTRVQGAYDTLSDEAKRAQYDQSLRTRDALVASDAAVRMAAAGGGGLHGGRMHHHFSQSQSPPPASSFFRRTTSGGGVGGGGSFNFDFDYTSASFHHPHHDAAGGQGGRAQAGPFRGNGMGSFSGRAGGGGGPSPPSSRLFVDPFGGPHPPRSASAAGTFRGTPPAGGGGGDTEMGGTTPPHQQQSSSFFAYDFSFGNTTSPMGVHGNVHVTGSSSNSASNPAGSPTTPVTGMRHGGGAGNGVGGGQGTENGGRSRFVHGDGGAEEWRGLRSRVSVASQDINSTPVTGGGQQTRERERAKAERERGVAGAPGLRAAAAAAAAAAMHGVGGVTGGLRRSVAPASSPSQPSQQSTSQGGRESEGETPGGMSTSSLGGGRSDLFDVLDGGAQAKQNATTTGGNVTPPRQPQSSRGGLGMSSSSGPPSQRGSKGGGAAGSTSSVSNPFGHRGSPRVSSREQSTPSTTQFPKGNLSGVTATGQQEEKEKDAGQRGSGGMNSDRKPKPAAFNASEQKPQQQQVTTPRTGSQQTPQQHKTPPPPAPAPSPISATGASKKGGGSAQAGGSDWVHSNLSESAEREKETGGNGGRKGGPKPKSQSTGLPSTSDGSSTSGSSGVSRVFTAAYAKVRREQNQQAAPVPAPAPAGGVKGPAAVSSVAASRSSGGVPSPSARAVEESVSAQGGSAVSRTQQPAATSSSSFQAAGASSASSGSLNAGRRAASGLSQLRSSIQSLSQRSNAGEGDEGEGERRVPTGLEQKQPESSEDMPSVEGQQRGHGYSPHRYSNPQNQSPHAGLQGRGEEEDEDMMSSSEQMLSELIHGLREGSNRIHNEEADFLPPRKGGGAVPEEGGDVPMGVEEVDGGGMMPGPSLLRSSGAPVSPDRMEMDESGDIRMGFGERKPRLQQQPGLNTFTPLGGAEGGEGNGGMKCEGGEEDDNEEDGCFDDPTALPAGVVEALERAARAQQQHQQGGGGGGLLEKAAARRQGAPAALIHAPGPSRLAEASDSDEDVFADFFAESPLGKGGKGGSYVDSPPSPSSPAPAAPNPPKRQSKGLVSVSGGLKGQPGPHAHAAVSTPGSKIRRQTPTGAGPSPRVSPSTFTAPPPAPGREVQREGGGGRPNLSSPQKVPTGAVQEGVTGSFFTAPSRGGGGSQTFRQGTTVTPSQGSNATVTAGARSEAAIGVSPQRPVQKGKGGGSVNVSGPSPSPSWGDRRRSSGGSDASSFGFGFRDSRRKSAVASAAATAAPLSGGAGEGGADEEEWRETETG